MRALQERGPLAALRHGRRREEATGGPGPVTGRRPAIRWRLRLLTGVIVVVVVAADQATKSWAEAALARHALHVVGSVALRLTYNSGAAFSIGQGLTRWLEVVGLVLVAVLVAVSRRMATPLGSVAVGLVLGGALGNLADRLFRGNGGAVIDFIYTRYWPTFNLADASIVVGALLMVLAGRRAGGRRAGGQQGRPAPDPGGPPG